MKMSEEEDVKKTFFSLQCNKTVGESEIMDASSIVEQDRAGIKSRMETDVCKRYKRRKR